ncbi:MAG: T9SS type A sorting domain-containing protein [Saprospiraceae bacterium]|nr:T9SS type A sorting domain-containing protein [Saprospiraceae bacterium]MCB0627075.1 T9SS type A sorting domain-containing protein [Saprospiraceae bacterium]MCB0676107.1 T9SS type A sorting domain-containing protein [Saprospiraceae bacterium]MCB0683999.1 T9SS type A sorting domain-containing protein [Saprospiraceae bacterium]
MKPFRVPLLFFLLFFAFLVQGQSLELCRQVVGFAGTSVTTGTLNHASTLGETVIVRRSTASRVLTQGFHQPELCILTDVSALDLGGDWRFGLFPNPASRMLFLEWEGAETMPAMQLSIFDLLGRRHALPVERQENDRYLIDCRSLPAGNYFLHALLPESRNSRSFPFVILR